MRRMVLLPGWTLIACVVLVAVPVVYAQTDTTVPSPTPSVTAIPIYATIYQTTNLRSGPDTRFDIVAQLGRGDRVQVIGRDAPSATALTPTAAGWFFVVTDDSQSGWIPIFSVELDTRTPLNTIPVYEVDPTPPSGEAGVQVVAYGRVNVRSGPAISYEIVGQLDVDDTATAIARSSAMNDWLLIEFEEIEGWVAYFTVRVNGNPAALPILVPDSTGGALVMPSQIVRALFNVRLHADPTLNSPTVVIAPFDNRVTVLARTSDSTWLYVDFESIAGWGVAELFSPIIDLESVPIFDPSDALSTPESTPAL